MRFLHRLIRNLILPNNAGPNDPAIVIGPDVPTELTTFYAAQTLTVVAAFIYRLDANDYIYEALVVPSGGGLPVIRATGECVGGTVAEHHKLRDRTSGPEIFMSPNAFITLPDTTSSTPAMELTTVMPSELTSFYSTYSLVPVSGIFYRVDSNDYIYQVMLRPSGGGVPAIMAVGQCNSGTVLEHHRTTSASAGPVMRLGPESQIILPDSNTATTPAIEITPRIPSELASFYSGEVVISGIFHRFDSNDYLYDVLICASGPALPIKRGIGQCVSGTVEEHYQIVQSGLAPEVRFEDSIIKLRGTAQMELEGTSQIFTDSSNGSIVAGPGLFEFDGTYTLDTTYQGRNYLVCAVHRTATQSIPNNTFTAVSFTATDIYDPGALHSTVTNPSRIAIPFTGRYVAIGGATFAADAVLNQRSAQIRLNGTTLQDPTHTSIPGSDTSATTVNVRPIPFSATAGDYVELMVYQNTGGSINILGSATDSTPALALYYLGV